MKRIYVPEGRLSLDESMMLWHGRLVFKQYIMIKRHKYCIKCFQFCQFDGIVLRACISSGQPFEDVNDFGQTGIVVLRPSEDTLDKGYSLFVDNYYNSIQLTKYLATKSTYICGTLNPIRKGIPREVKRKKGEFVWRRRGEIQTRCTYYY